MSSILTTRNFKIMKYALKNIKFIGYYVPLFRSVSTVANLSQTPEATATSMIKYFFRKGNKVSTETAIRKRFKGYAKKAPNTLPDHPQPKRTSLFKSFFISATPFIGLKTQGKRRGKIVKHKVATLSSGARGRKSFLEFSSMVCTSGRAAKPFISRFYSELNTLYTYSHKRSSGSVVPVSPFYEKRALLYKTAYSAFLPSVRVKPKS